MQKLQRPLPVARIVRPHSSERSSTRTLAPASAAVTAHASPAAPPPTTHMSARAGSAVAAAMRSSCSRSRARDPPRCWACLLRPPATLDLARGDVDGAVALLGGLLGLVGGSRGGGALGHRGLWALGLLLLHLKLG